jgi:glycosyltransferase involved in cell wall biosynthesis
LTVDVDGRSNSGTARVATELICELSRYSSIFQTFVHFQEGVGKIYELPGTNEIIIPIGSNWLTKRRSISFIRWAFRYRFTKRSEKFDVVHWHSSRLFPLFFLFPSKKTVVTLHDVGQRILPGVNTFATRVHYWNARLFQFKIHRIIAVSKTAMKDMETIGKFKRAKLAFIYNGTNFEFLKAKALPNYTLPSKFVLCVSRWQPHKNVETIVRAVHEMESFLANAGITFVLVGKPVGDYDLPSRLIAKFKLDSLIHVLSDLSDENIAYLYDNALLSIAPSIHEGFGLSVLEGMTRGCVSMVHKDASTKEIAGESGIHLDMKDLSSFVSVFKDAVQHPDRLKFKREKAVILSRNYTWESSAKELMLIYEMED